MKSRQNILITPNVRWLIMSLAAAVMFSASSGIFAAVTGQAVPVLNEVTPSSGTQGDTGLVLSISGEHLSTAFEVVFDGDGITVDSIDDVSPTQISFTISIAPDAVTGLRNIIVDTGFGEIVLGDAFDVLEFVPPPTEPVIESIYPPGMPVGQSGYVIISGSQLDAATQVDFGDGITVRGFDPSDVEIIASVTIDENAEPGARVITVTDPNFVVVFENGFEILPATPADPATPPSPPCIENIYPNGGVAGDEEILLTLSGRHFGTVEWVAVAGIDAVIENQTESEIEVRFGIPEDFSTGYYDVVAGGSAGESTLSRAFEIKGGDIEIDSVYPSEVFRGQRTLITIHGSNFDGVNEISLNSYFRLVSTPEIESDVIKLDIVASILAPLGSVDINLRGWRIDETIAGVFELIPGLPSIESIDRSEGVRGTSGLSIMITGQNLDSLMLFEISGDGVELSSAGYVDPTQIYVTFDISSSADATLRDIIIGNASGLYTLPNAFAVLVGEPSIVAVFPQSGTQCDRNLRVIISGTNLDNVSEITFADGVMVTAFETISQFNTVCEINISPDAQPGYCDISVVTSDGGFARIIDGFQILENQNPQPSGIETEPEPEQEEEIETDLESETE